MLEADFAAALVPHLLDLLVDLLLPFGYLIQGGAFFQTLVSRPHGLFWCVLADNHGGSRPSGRRWRGKGDGDKGAVGEPLPVLLLRTVLLLPGAETPVTRETFHLVDWMIRRRIFMVTMT